MESIAIAQLKSHLSEQVKKAAAGTRILILDHRRPVAMLTPVQDEVQIVKSASGSYRYTELAALTSKDSLTALLQERQER